MAPKRLVKLKACIVSQAHTQESQTTCLHEDSKIGFSIGEAKERRVA